MGTRGSYDLKYTDRDVRENREEFTRLATSYLASYGGDFEPIVSAQKELRTQGMLTTATIRRVLNCMRHDWRAGLMPSPKGYNLGSNMTFPKAKEVRKILAPTCTRTDLHETHRVKAIFESQQNGWCKGVENGRRDFAIPFKRLDAMYVVAPTGLKIHLVHPDLSLSGIHYPVNNFGPGYRTPPYVEVKVVCKNPSWVTRPHVMMDRDAALKYTTRRVGASAPQDVAPCKRCFPEGI